MRRKPVITARPSSTGTVNVPKPKAWSPADYTLADVHAIKACVAGEASPDQQKRAIDYIIRVLAGTYDMAYRPDSSRDTDFALGRQHVGLQLVYFINVNAGLLKRSSDIGSSSISS